MAMGANGKVRRGTWSVELRSGSESGAFEKWPGGGRPKAMSVSQGVGVQRM